MSEIVAEEDPDPLPLREYGINSQTGLSYDGLLSSRYIEEVELSITPEMRQQEEGDLRILSAYVDRLLAGEGDMTITSGSAQLKRKHFPNGDELYFFIDGTYCRSWSKGGQRVNWCSDQLRHGSAVDVLAYLKDTFGSSEPMSNNQRSKGAVMLGRKVLVKLLRKS